MKRKSAGCKKCGSYQNRKAYLQHLKKEFPDWPKKEILEMHWELFTECHCALWAGHGAKNIQTFLMEIGEDK